MKEVFLVPTPDIGGYKQSIGITLLMLLGNIFRSFCMSIMHRNVSSYNLDSITLKKRKQ